MHRSAEEAMMEESEQCGGSSWYDSRIISMGTPFVDPFADERDCIPRTPQTSQGWSPRKTIKSAGRGIKKGAKVTAKYGTKGAMLATAPARLMLNASVWGVFAPIRLITNNVINRYVSEFKKRGKVVTKVQGRTWLYGTMAKSRNPILRGGVLLLKQYGPGTSPMVRITGDFVGSSNFVGSSFVGAGPAAAVPALTAALQAAVPALTNMAIAAASAAALAAAKKGVDAAFRGRGGAPIHVVPSDTSVDNALEPEPDGMEGWEAGCCG